MEDLRLARAWVATMFQNPSFLEQTKKKFTPPGVPLRNAEALSIALFARCALPKAQETLPLKNSLPSPSRWRTRWH
jgi:hypothetical protein